MPAWWPLLQAARYLNVAPWDLEGQPFWRSVALCAMDAERRVREQSNGGGDQ